MLRPTLHLGLAAILTGAAIGTAFLLPLPAQAQPATGAATPTRPEQIPLRDFFRDPERGYFRLSADGRWLGFMQPVGEPRRRNVFVQRLEGTRPVGAPRQLTQETARDIAVYRWKGGRTVLYEKDFGGDENFHVVAVDAVTGVLRDLTPWDGVRAEVVDDLPDDPAHILVSHNRRDRKAMDVVRLNIRTGAESTVARNPGNVVSWVSDHAGRVRVAVASDGVDNTVSVRAGDRGPFAPIIRTDFRTQVQPLFFDAANRRFYANSNRGRDRAALVLIDPARPDAEQVVFEHPRVDSAGASFSRRRKVLTTATFQVDRTERHYFDAATRTMFARLERRLPGMELALQSETRDEDKFVVAASSDRTPGTRYVYDRRRDELTKLGEISPWLPEALMAPMKPVQYTARDGLAIPAYLTLPLNREPRNLACVVNPHGGPWARDAWGFNPEVQFLASRGLCVLQMNFRGSTGYGRRFWEASFGQWGLAMQDDVSDGVKWLVEQGIADSRRIGLYGASYGGYATLAGVTFTPELYAAAVDYVGVSNLFTFMKTIPPYWEPFRDQMYKMVGNPDDPADAARMKATSPVFHADRIRTPLLVAQGARDPRVNKDESEQIVQALRERGVAVQYLVKDDEGHGFANEENRFEFYAAMEAFLREHLRP
jgi:dipeptidyl aminopeptidase/acylaminoacyl peptidase